MTPVELEPGLMGSDVLFIGLGASAVGWYRCYLPALFLGADWIGVTNTPPDLRIVTGLVANETKLANFLDYKVIVVQQPRGGGWLRLIRDLQAQGIKVVFEVDDYLHAIRKTEDHDFRQYFNKSALEAIEMCMRVCDAVICSTPYIARRYRKFNHNIWLCRNGLDTGRYDLTRPPREMVTIGWAGATGHAAAVLPWIEATASAMLERPNTCFASIGQDFADALADLFPQRTLSVPFTMVETYPAAMTLFDIALAPAGKGNFFRGKSDLRWLEAGALGIPTIADPIVYPAIEHGVNGFHAESPEEVMRLLLHLVDDPDLRLQVGEAARRYVIEHRDMKVACRQWEQVFRALLG
jgi:glycosyltransferase involved in cell wall biosynthesis